MCSYLDISSLMLLLSCSFWKKCGLWETLVCLWSFVLSSSKLQKLSTFSALKCNIIKRERWSISLFMTFTQKLRIGTNKTNSWKKIKWIFTCFETSAFVYLSCLIGNLFIILLFQILIKYFLLCISHWDLSIDFWIIENWCHMKKLCLFEILWNNENSHVLMWHGNMILMWKINRQMIWHVDNEFMIRIHCWQIVHWVKYKAAKLFFSYRMCVGSVAKILNKQLGTHNYVFLLWTNN